MSTDEKEGDSTPPPPEPGLGRAVGLMGSANAVGFGTGIVRQKLFALYLGPSGFGVYAVLASLFDLLTTLTSLGAPTGLLRESSAAMRRGDRAHVARLLSLVRRVLLGISLALVVGMLAVGPRLAARMEVPFFWVVLVAMGLPAVVMSATSDAVMNALGELRRLAMAKISVSLLSLVAMAVLVSLYGLLGSVVQIVTGAFIGAIVSMAFLRGLLPSSSSVRLPPLGLDSAALRVVFAVGLAQTAVHAAATLNQFFFRTTILLELGAVQNGLYQGVMGLSRQYYGAISAGLFVHVYPSLSRRIGDPSAVRAEVARALRFVLAGTVPIALVLLAGRDYLVRLVFTAEFLDVVPLMAWTVPSDVLQILLGVLRMTVLATSASGAFLALGLAFEGVYFVSFVIGISVAGLTGGIIAYTVTTVLGGVLFGAFLLRAGSLSVSADFVLRFLAAVIILVGAAALPLELATRAGMLLTSALWLYWNRHELRSAF